MNYYLDKNFNKNWIIAVNKLLEKFIFNKKSRLDQVDKKKQEIKKLNPRFNLQ